ncbi:leucine-rich repeat-containing protein 49 isoform X3 [Diabrotica virgifera virgifera]|uniref:Dynein axonemal assembly factor 1 homolog n=1 Tax=Diabrotica virgifera virgifera TaxID=50390 RepID=A0ABM5JQP8_DIAVI|nr:leucine-rich repeat-containing protein 49 isoform X3 [Diabrotica virgifera virgifera]
MPISSSAATVEKKKAFKLQNPVKSIDHNERQAEKNLLKIGPALPGKTKRNFYVRSHSTLNASAITKIHDTPVFCEAVTLRTHSDGLLHVSRVQEEKETHPDRISLDRRGLNSIPIIDGEPKLRLLSMQHNLVTTLEMIAKQSFPTLVFLDIYDNQLEQIQYLDELTNLRVLLMGKNSVEDISSLAKSSNIKEISIDNNPVLLGGDCISFLVSYLPLLNKLNSMQITEQVRKAAMAWRRNKEASNSTFMDLTNDVSLTCRREEVISNARTNWEFLRSQTKCLTNNGNVVEKSLKNLKPDLDFIMTPLRKSTTTPIRPVKSKSCTKVPVLPDKKFNLLRTSSQETENSQNTSSSNEYFKLPPILVPIINKMEEKSSDQGKPGSLTSVGPNIDSSVSSVASSSEVDAAETTCSCISKESDSDNESECDVDIMAEELMKKIPRDDSLVKSTDVEECRIKNCGSADTSSVLSGVTTLSNISNPSNSSGENLSKTFTRNIRSAVHSKTIPTKCLSRAVTAKTKKQSSPALPKDREQGGDYLIEICGRHLNVYGQGALRFIDKIWNVSKAQDVTTIKFNYVNFNSVNGVLSKIKHRFPNVGHFVFKETNITCLGQLNALAETQGLTSLYIDPEGNPICEKKWESYAIFRLAHWGLKNINDKEITETDVKAANEEYQGLSDLVLWSLPDSLLQPLLVRMRIDISNNAFDQDAKKWLLNADPDLKSVISKEALQWKKPSLSQEENTIRYKAKQQISHVLDDMANAMNKLVILDEQWPNILHNFVQNTLLDYSQLDLYMKQKMQELSK